MSLVMRGLSDSEDLVRGIVAHQERLYRYVFALCPREHDARDVLQETCVALLRNAESYDTTKAFLPWAYKFAQLEVLKYRERLARTQRLLDADVIELIARQRQGIDEVLQQRLTKLDGCLKSLSPRDRELIESRYESAATSDEVAVRVGVSRRTLFRELQRIRRQLLGCLEQRAIGGAT
jgi:RNA polymerase sigma-70 factor (ECF subfamily)